MHKEIQKLLTQHDVSEKQYTIWAWNRFRSQAFWSGIVIGILFVSPLLWAANSAYHEKNMTEFWGMIVGAVFVGFLFLIGSFWAKSTTIDYMFDPAYTPRGFEALDVIQRMNPRYVSKLNAQHWIAIQKINVQSFERKEAAKRPGVRANISKERITHLIELKLKMKKWGLIGTGLLSLTLITFPFYLPHLMTDSWESYAVMSIVGLTFFVAVIGMHAWLFLYGYIGYLQREIILYGEWAWDDTIHHGKSATVFGVIAMIMGSLSFAAFMLIPLALLLGAK